MNRRQKVLLSAFIACVTTLTHTIAIPPITYPQMMVQDSLDISKQAAGRALFSPRVDYTNEWRPVGHSDPLKNDPTFDYSPPVLDRVRYWGNDAASNDKSDILLLGVPSKHVYFPQKQHPNQITQFEQKNSNRRIFYAPQLSRILTPPPMPNPMSLSYWPGQENQINDAFAEESSPVYSIAKPFPTIQGPLPSEIKNTNNPIRFENSAAPSVLPERKTPWLQSLLQKEAQPIEIETSYSPAFFETHSTHVNSIYNEQTPTTIEEVKTTPHPVYETTTYFTPTTLPPVTMTTDEIFSHYKQPVEALTGPMYLIIQGHSRVKTYGQQTENVTDRHAPKMVPIVATKDPVIMHVVNKDDIGNEMNVPHVSEKNDVKIETTTGASTMDSLLSLLDNSFSGFLLGDKNTSEKVKTEKDEKSTNKKQSKDGAKKAKDSTKKSTKLTTSAPEKGDEQSLLNS